MASSPRAPDLTSSDDGFATPAAVVISLAMATLAVAIQVRAISALHASQADYLRTAAELRLDGAQFVAGSDLFAGRITDRDRTHIVLDSEPVDVRFEPEGAKLSLSAATSLPPQVLAALGSTSPGRTVSGLGRLAAQFDADPADLRAVEASPQWKACAPRFISAYGAARTPNDVANFLDHGGSVEAHAGEVWRIVTRDRWGWTDDRLVRVVGDAGAPVRTIFRTFNRQPQAEPACPSSSFGA